MKKKLTDEEINQIKNSLKTKLDKHILRLTLDNFQNMYDALESKMHLDVWSEQDKREVLTSFQIGCQDASNKSCFVVIKEFNKLFNFSDYESKEYCRCCLFSLHCSGDPKNKIEDNWHYNVCLIWTNLAKGPFDLDYIKDKWSKIENSNDLQNLRDAVEEW